MENPYDHMINQQLMAVSIFSFLDNLLDHVRQAEQEAEAEMAETVNESVDPVARSQKEAGGYPEEIFIHLIDADKEEISCSICYGVLRDAHQCKNLHRFCYSCIYAWSTTTGASSDFCPVCRCDAFYGRNELLNERIQKLRCTCKETNCNWRGELKDLESHEHRRYTDQELGLTTALPVIKPRGNSNISTTTIGTVGTESSPKVPTGSSSTAAVASRESGAASTGLTSLLSRRQSTSELVREATSRTTRNPSSPAAPTPPTPRATTSGANNLLSRRESQTPRRITASTQETVHPAGDGLYQANSAARRPSLTTPSTPTPPPPQAPAPSPPSTVTNRPSATATSSGPSTPETPIQTPPTVASHTPRPPSVPRTSSSSGGSGMFRSRMSSMPRQNTEAAGTPTSTSPATVTTLTPAAAVVTSPSDSNTSNSAEEAATTEESRGYGDDPVVYRRLVPVERRSRVTARLRESREQLAMMLTLMTLELEDRRRSVELQMSFNMHRQRIRSRQMAEMTALNQRLAEVTGGVSGNPSGMTGAESTGSSTPHSLASSSESSILPPILALPSGSRPPPQSLLRSTQFSSSRANFPNSDTDSSSDTGD